MRTAKVLYKSSIVISQMTGTAAKENMPAFDFTEIWVTTDSYPVLFWEQ